MAESGSCRRLVDLSQEQFALRASLHRTEISRLEHGERVPRIDTLVRLMNALEARPMTSLTGWDQSSERGCRPPLVRG